MSERILAVTGSVLLVAIVGASLLGIGSCVRRNWNFEDACRRAGGVVMNSAALTSSSATATSRDVCAKVVQSPVAQPIELPGYAR